MRTCPLPSSPRFCLSSTPRRPHACRPSHRPGEDNRLAPIALGLRSLDGIEDMHGAACDLYHHNGMRRWRMAEQVALHTDYRIVAAPYPLTEIIEAPVLVERRTRASVD